MKNQIEKTEISATVEYNHNGLHRQRSFAAETEEQLLNNVFLFFAERYSERHRYDIKSVSYHGQQLRWNDFLAHNTFAKGRLSFEEFKTMCLTPEKLAV